MKKVFITLLSMTMVGTAIAGTNDASNDFKAGENQLPPSLLTSSTVCTTVSRMQLSKSQEHI